MFIMLSCSTGIQQSDSSITQFPMDNGSCSSIVVPSSDQVQFNHYYPALIVVPIQSLQNSTAQASVFEPSNHLQQNLQYFFIPQEFDAKYSDFMYLSDPQYQNFVNSPDSPNSPSFCGGLKMARMVIATGMPNPANRVKPRSSQL